MTVVFKKFCQKADTIIKNDKMYETQYLNKVQIYNFIARTLRKAFTIITLHL